MAESDSILQLGIEAARDGNRDEARNLFRLLTVQDPGNAQAWLWLAGVAENRDERQAALERVVDLDPTNEMAVKGLQALGVRPTVRLRDDTPLTPPREVESDTAATVATAAAAAAVATTRTPDNAVHPPLRDVPPVDERSRFDIDDDDDPFAALDNLSDAMASSPTAVRRNDPSPSEYDEFNDLSDAMSADAGPARRTGSSPRLSSNELGGTTRTSPRATTFEEDEDTEPARRGLSPLLIGLLGLIALLLIGLLAWRLFFNNDGGVAGNGGITDPGAGGVGVATSVPTDVIDGSGVLTGTGNITNTGSITDTAGTGTGPIVGTDVTTPTAEAPPVAPPDQPPPVGQPDLAAAQPAVVAAGTPLESNGWTYDFNRPTYAAPIVGNLGSFAPQGRFAVVLVFISNNTGTAQAIPANFFVLKDAQGRVYNSLPDVSNAYVQPGINADLRQGDAVPADGLVRSVALIFDVAPDATNLVFFAASKPDQGWQVLNNVQ